MPNITVKNIPKDLYDDLKQQARLNHRSINNEIIFCIKRSLKSERLDPKEFLDQLEKLHSTLEIPNLTEDLLNESRRERR